MKKDKRTMRRVILSNLYQHLHAYYDVGYTRELFVGGHLSLHEIDAVLAYKSESRLEQLRSALDRLEDGTYGICIHCKKEISQKVLETDPAQRFCFNCERELSHSVMVQLESPVAH